MADVPSGKNVRIFDRSIIILQFLPTLYFETAMPKADEILNCRKFSGKWHIWRNSEEQLTGISSIL